MPTIGWFEILIVVAVAIVVLGPKDFPIMLKKVGSWIGTAKKYINNIQNEVSNIDLEDQNIQKKDTFKYVKKVSCKAVKINLLFVESSFTAWAYGSTKKPYKCSANK